MDLATVASIQPAALAQDPSTLSLTATPRHRTLGITVDMSQQHLPPAGCAGAEQFIAGARNIEGARWKECV